MSIKDETFFEYPTFDNVRDIINYTVNRFPNNTAFILKHKDDNNVTYESITYKELKGKRVAIISKNRYEWVLSFVALLLGGIVVVPLDKDLEFGEFEKCLIRSKADAIIFSDKFEESIKQIRANGNTNIREYIAIDESAEFKNLMKVRDDGKKLLEEGNKKYINAEIKEKELLQEQHQNQK